MKKYVKIKDFCGIVMSSERDNIVEFNQNPDIESLIIKIEGCASNPEKSSTTKIGKHIPCRYSVPTIWNLEYMEYRKQVYYGKDCMKKFCT